MTVELAERWNVDSAAALLTGNQAVVRLMLAQAAADRKAALHTGGFVSGYRGSPLAGLDMAFASAQQALAENDIRFHPGLNEDLAATAVWGTQQIHIVPKPTHDGVFGLWYGKGPGVDRSGDALKHANAAGTSKYGGVIALAGDDHVAQSSSLAHQSEFALMDALLPVLVPATLAELIDYGLHAYALSRFSGLWVGMKVTAAVIETTAVMGRAHDKVFNSPDIALPGSVHLRWPDAPQEQEARLYDAKLPAARAWLEANPLHRFMMRHRSDVVGIVTAGKSALDVTATLEMLGIKEGQGVRVLKLGAVWPPQPQVIHEFAKGLKEIVVVEEKRALIETQIRDILYGTAKAPRIVGKQDDAGQVLLRGTLDLKPAIIAEAIGPRLAAATGRAFEQLSPIPPPPPSGLARTPFFCSGCPHNSSTKVPEGSLALGGIGCHSMAMYMGRGMTAYTHMGGEGANWIGIAPFTKTPHIFQNLGDGTYFHSGLLAIRAAVAAHVSITYKILFNNAVAMTGGQPVDGELTVAALVQQLKAEGVDTIIVLTDDQQARQADCPAARVLPREAIETVSLELRDKPGVSVLIYDRECAAERRRKIARGLRPAPKTRVFINTAVCEGCDDCVVASNCLSVVPHDTALGRKRRIDQASCNTDLTCLNGFCPSLVTVENAALTRPDARALDVPDLPEPPIAPLDRPQRILICGVGGTGIVTIGALIAMAARIDGLSATGLDATGMAQKGGSVWSHLTIAQDAIERPAETPDGKADCLIAGDPIVAMDQRTRAKLSVATHGVVNDEAPPTAADVLAASGKASSVRPVDLNGLNAISATSLARQATGNAATANVLLLGYASQSGWLPVLRTSLETAIRLNGREIEANMAAFTVGRMLALGIASNTAARQIELLSHVEREQHLLAYGGPKYVSRYRLALKQAQALESNIPGAFAAVSAAHHHLLAIKDEWEVARLFIDSSFRSTLHETFASGFRLRYHFAGGGLTAVGSKRKRSFGRIAVPMLWLLSKGRGLRGSVFDPFRKSAERQADRERLANYEQLLSTMLEAPPQDIEAACELLSLPLSIKGFGHVRARKAAQAAERAIDLEARLWTA